MRLEEYLKKYKITCKSFGAKVGVSDAQVTRIINKKRNPSPHLMKRIQEETNGEVSFEDLFNPEAPSRLKKKEFEKTKT